MVPDALLDPFETAENKIFQNRDAFSPKYVPSRLIGREKEIKQIGAVLAPALTNNRPYNAFIYGKTGVGKTAVTKYVLLRLEERLKEGKAHVKSVFVNCNQVNTTTKILRKISNVIAPDVDIPFTGLATSEYYAKLWKILDDFQGITIVVLDEVDKLDDDNILYNLSRARENLDITTGDISILGISNDLTYKERLDARTISSFGTKEFVFPPYDANQLREILEDRAHIGFKDGVLDDEVIPLCAAFAAQEHGDARRAIMLLEWAGEPAVEKDNERVTEGDVREAQARLEIDRIVETIKTLPLHQKRLLHAIALSEKEKQNTDEIYAVYKDLCAREAAPPLSKVRISVFISELSMLGLITTRKEYRGRGGRIRWVSPGIPRNKVLDILAGE